MANGGRIDFEVGFNVNSNSLKNILRDLKSIQSLVSDDLIQAGDPRSLTKIEEGLHQAKESAKEFSKLLESSFNKELGIMNVAKFQQSLKGAGLTLQSLEKDLSGAGNIGTTAFKQICNQILTTKNYKKKNILFSRIF